MDTMKTGADNQGRLIQLVEKTGGWYILLIVILAQLPFIPGALIGGAIIQVNGGLTTKQLYLSGVATLVAILLGFLVIFVYVYGVTDKARKRLGEWARNAQLESDTGEERTAWKQIASLPWLYGFAVTGLVLFFEIGSVSAYQYFILRLNSDQVSYSILGGLVPGITVIVLAILTLEQLLVPAREILLPRKFENQVKGSTNGYIFNKFLFIGMAFIFITALLIAPIGYHKTYTAIYEEISSLRLFNDLRNQLIIATIFSVIIGFGLTYLLSRSLTIPIDSLIQTFTRVEAGNLSERARVLATDEIGELAIYFNRMISRLDELQQTLEKRVAERTNQLRVSGEVGRIATTILDPDTVITRVVELITESFDYYYAAIFLVDKNDYWAELKAATGSAGEILMERHHRLQVNKTSMVGTAITTREAQVALDVGEMAVRFNNPLLPNTRSEIAIPLTVGGRVIGALDVQSIRGADFKPEVISTLQSMANQVAIAIENARLFKEMEQTVNELKLTNRQYILSSWSEKLKSSSLEYTSGSALNQTFTGAKEIEVKLNLRDESIGQIQLEKEGDWTEEDQAWVESLATQVAVSLENARLIEESQQTANKERLSASIVQKLWSTNSTDAILQTAIRELGKALEASEATIQLKMDE